MKSVVAPFALVAAIVAGSEARAAQARATETPWLVAEETAPPIADHGLEARISLLARDGTQPSGEFATLGDALLQLRLRNVGEAPIDLLVDGDSWYFGAASLLPLIDVELLRDDGTPIERPGFWIGCKADPDTRDLLAMTALRRLAKGEVALRRAPFAELVGLGQLALPDGLYRLRVTYRGIAEPVVRTISPWSTTATHAKSAWRGAAWSQELRFRIAGAPQPEVWSEPQEGLRVAVVTDPAARRVFLGETVAVRYLVENVSDAPIDFLRPFGSSQDDSVELRDAGGEPIGLAAFFCTGIDPSAQWSLPPGGRVWIVAAPVVFGLDRFHAGSRWTDAALLPGRYQLRATLRLDDGALPNGVERVGMRQLFTPPFEVEVLDRAAK